MSIMNSIIESVKKEGTKVINKKKFRDEVMIAVRDGKLTLDEIDELEKKKKELGLTEIDIRKIKIDAYGVALSTTKIDGVITKSEENELNEIQKFFGLEDEEIKNEKDTLARFRLLREISEGNIPTITVSNIIIGKNEKAYWIEPSNLMEEKVVKTEYVGGSRGVSFRLMKGVNYRVGAHKGHLETKKDVVCVSTGNMIITNKRIIFSGDKKSFSLKMNKILDLHLFSNAIKLNEIEKTKPRLMTFSKENGEIICAILNYAINHFSKED